MRSNEVMVNRQGDVDFLFGLARIGFALSLEVVSLSASWRSSSSRANRRYN